MSEKEAINVLVQAAEIGQKSGIYSLKDSALIYTAINLLVPTYFNENNEQQPVPQEGGNDSEEKK